MDRKLLGIFLQVLSAWALCLLGFVICGAAAILALSPQGSWLVSLLATAFALVSLKFALYLRLDAEQRLKEYDAQRGNV